MKYIQVYKEGIERTIKAEEQAKYIKMGYIKVTKYEPQPIQEDVKPVDDYVVAKKTPVKKKKVTKKGG